MTPEFLNPMTTVVIFVTVTIIVIASTQTIFTIMCYSRLVDMVLAHQLLLIVARIPFVPRSVCCILAGVCRGITV